MATAFTEPDAGADKVTITMPEPTASQADIESFIDYVAREHGGMHGTKSLVHKLRRYLINRDIADRYWRGAVTSLNVVNGVRSVYAPVNSKEKTITKFYELQSTAALRKHCAMFGIPYDEYESQEDIIAALVQRVIEEDL